MGERMKRQYLGGHININKTTLFTFPLGELACLPAGVEEGLLTI
jgi:hypothetical protein